MNCGCVVRNSKVIESCDMHIAILKKNRNVALLLAEAKVNRIFKDNYLYELKEEVITELRKMRQ